MMKHYDHQNWRKVTAAFHDDSSRTSAAGHMEKHETEIKLKLEMETGKGNWEWKWEQKAPITDGMFSS